MSRYTRLAVLLSCVVVPAASVSAQSAVDPVDEAFAPLTQSVPTPPIAFVGITPCRLADTRGNGFSGAFGPPSMVAATPRVFPVAGHCGIPLSAQAVSANLAVTNTSGAGFISVWPGGAPQPNPLVASQNFAAGQTIANAVLAPLGEGGITVYARVGLDLIIDVNGYFDTGAAAPPCFDNANRYVNCGNGTVTDTVTGLIWLKNANCFLTGKTYSAANQAAAGLAAGQCGLTDGSSAGDWRLPTNAEWEATVARAVALGCTSAGSGDPPSLTNDAGTGCLIPGPTSFTGVQSSVYWSSSALEGGPNNAWIVFLNSGNVSNVALKVNSFFVWPVRGGQ